MSEFENKRKAAEKAEKRNDVRKEKLAGFFFNLAQVTFTVFVLGLLLTLTKEELYDNYFLIALLILGIFLTVFFYRIGNNILKY